MESYELQVAASAQGKGLGKKLLCDLEKIGKGFNMEKIMLTVLKCKSTLSLSLLCRFVPDTSHTANSKARSFYTSLGYEIFLFFFSFSLLIDFIIILRFTVDATSPCQGSGQLGNDPEREEDLGIADYEILSKVVVRIQVQGGNS